MGQSSKVCDRSNDMFSSNFSLEKTHASDPKLKEVFESGRPLYSTLLNMRNSQKNSELESLGIKSNSSVVREYYAVATHQKELHSLRKSIKEKFKDICDEKLEAIEDLNELNAFAKKFKKSKRSKTALTKSLGLEEKVQYLFEATTKGLSNSIIIPTFFEGLVSEDKEELNESSKIEDLINSLFIEKLNSDSSLQEKLWKCVEDKTTLHTSKNEKSEAKVEDSRYKSFYSFKESYKTLAKPEAASKYLNLRRGVSQGDLQIEFKTDSSELISIVTNHVAPMSHRAKLDSSLVDWAIKFSDTYVQSFQKTISKELSSRLRSSAEKQVLPKIKDNLRRVLMSPGLGRQIIMGVSPSGKQTCRISVIDREGLHKESATVPLLEAEKASETEAVFLALIQKHQVQAITISDHAGARAIERSLRATFRNVKLTIPIALIPAEPCDDYASSKSGQEDFPDIDTPSRKSIFAARQLQDPLREFVRIKAKSLGVGQFLNEVHPESLAKCLHEVTLDAVHEVGVDLNSASATLLSKVNGISEELAQNIIKFREDKGFFWSREQVLDVEGITPEIFEYCGPFLRVKDGKLLSDNSFLHPKHNKDILDAFKRLKIDHASYSEKADSLLGDEKLIEILGKPLTENFVKALKEAAPEVRGKFEFIQFRDDLQNVGDLKMGMVCPGRVSNVTTFGAFVDVGLHQDGLVHLSELSNTFVRDPYDVIHPGDLVTVKVIAVDPDKKQISFSMKGLAAGSERNKEIDKRSKEAQSKNQSRPQRPASSRPARAASGGGKPGDKRGGRSDSRPHARPGRGKPGSSNGGRSPRSPNRPDGLRNNAFAALANLKVK